MGQRSKPFEARNWTASTLTWSWCVHKSEACYCAATVTGIYFGKPRGFETSEEDEEIGFNTEIYSTPEINCIACIGFETAQRRHGKLCSVDKANILEASLLWRKCVTKLASEYPDVELTYIFVDNASMQLIRNPKQGLDLFEPIHGSAPDIAGQDKANSLVTVLSAVMLLRYGLGEEDAAKRRMLFWKL